MACIAELTPPCGWTWRRSNRRPESRETRRSVVFLEGLNAVTALAQGGDAKGGGFRTAERGHDRRAGIDRRGADLHAIRVRGGAGCGSDDDLDLAVLQEVHGVGPALGKLEDAAHFEPGLFQHVSGAAGRHQLEA